MLNIYSHHVVLFFLLTATFYIKGAVAIFFTSAACSTATISDFFFVIIFAVNLTRSVNFVMSLFEPPSSIMLTGTSIESHL